MRNARRNWLALASENPNHEWRVRLHRELDAAGDDAKQAPGAFGDLMRSAKPGWQ